MRGPASSQLVLGLRGWTGPRSVAGSQARPHDSIRRATQLLYQISWYLKKHSPNYLVVARELRKMWARYLSTQNREWNRFAFGMRGVSMVADPKRGWHRRQALQIASQLPEEPEDAWAVLGYVEQLVGFFFEEPPDPSPDPPDDQAVVRFPGGPSSPRRRARSTGRPSDLPK